MEQIITINSSNEDDFTKTVNNALKKGYTISSTSCGFVNSEKYGFCGCFMAILIIKK